MQKRVSSKIAGYAKPNQSQSQSQERPQASEQDMIADMTKGFLQAQATVNNKTDQNNSQEVVELLSKINSKLESLENSLNTGTADQGQAKQNTSSQSAQNQQTSQPQNKQPSSPNGQNESAMSQELRNLFSMMPQNNTNEQNGAANSEQSQGTGQNNQEQNQSANSDNKNQQNIAVQTVAQVLAQAQYELSNELEASLNKLKQVISESEKIAAKISNLLGEENSQK